MKDVEAWLSQMEEVDKTLLHSGPSPAHPVHRSVSTRQSSQVVQNDADEAAS
jgi:hypothetical protein